MLHQVYLFALSLFTVLLIKWDAVITKIPLLKKKTEVMAARQGTPGKENAGFQGQ